MTLSTVTRECHLLKHRRFNSIIYCTNYSVVTNVLMEFMGLLLSEFDHFHFYWKHVSLKGYLAVNGY